MCLQAFSDTAKSQAAAKKLAKGEHQQTRHIAEFRLVTSSQRVLRNASVATG